MATAQSILEYSFKDKILRKGNDTIGRPIRFKEGKDLQLRIRQYNPLKHDIIVEDSTVSYSIGDTAALARLIVLPRITSLSNLESITSNAPDDCGRLDQLTQELVVKKEALLSGITNYKALLAAFDVISDDYTYLKTLDELTGTAVAARLNTSAIANVNQWITRTRDEASRLPENAANVSSRQLRNLEEESYASIVAIEEQVQEIKDAVNALNGNCSTFVQKLKVFNNQLQAIMVDISGFKAKRTDLLLPGISKKMLLYDQLVALSVSNPSVNTRAFTVRGDEYTISIYSREPGTTNKVVHDYVNVTPKGGFRLNVSGGVFISGLYDASYAKKTKDSIYQSRYLNNGEIRDTTLSGSYVSLYEKKQEKIGYGGMLYLHATSQNGRMLNWGGFLGFGALFNDQARWAGSLGGTMVIGRKQRMNINVGAITAQADRLTPPYQPEVWYRETLDNIPTYKAWTVSWMVGFSWSFK